MSNLKTIMVVDNDPNHLSSITSVLGHEYEVLVASSISECLRLSKEAPPDLILLDLMMSGKLNGFDPKRAMQAQLQQHQLPIIYLSSEDNLLELPNGNSIESDEYIVFPFQASELSAKLKHATKQNLSLPKNTVPSHEIGDYTLAKFNEYMITNDFVKNSFYIHCCQDLSIKLIECLELIGLDCCVLVSSADTDYEYATGGKPCKSLESELLKTIKTGPKISEGGRRLFLNFDQISLIVKNMPEDDNSKYKRLRDYIIIMLNAAEVRLIDFSILEQKNAKVIKHIHNSIDEIKEILEQLETKHSNETFLQNNAHKRLSSELYARLSQLELSQDEKNTVISVVDEQLNKLNENRKHGQQLRENIKSFLGLVESLNLSLL